MKLCRPVKTTQLYQTGKFVLSKQRYHFANNFFLNFASHGVKISRLQILLGLSNYNQIFVCLDMVEGENVVKWLYPGTN